MPPLRSGARYALHLTALLISITCAIYAFALPLAASAATVIFLTSGTSWTVPSDWDSNNNTIEVIGGGAGGITPGTVGGGGGGGGAYSKVSNASLTPGASVTYAVGSGGGAGVAGGDTYFCNSTSNCATIAGTAVVVGAKGGGVGSTNTHGTGGAAASGVGTTKNSGGNGGDGGGTAKDGGGGGGGAAGPNGNGAQGGAGGADGLGNGGGGGGGGADNGSSGSAGGDGAGGAGGNGRGGSGGGAANSGDGSSGGGGGGARDVTGGQGGSDTEFDSSHGAGGGGGGGDGSNVASSGGAGALYGGGGGGGGDGAVVEGTGGAGKQGIVVITIKPFITINANTKFAGNLTITGSLTKSSGTFEIDDPLDPANKLLFHSFVESPDVKNIYNGNATLDKNGEVVIELPEYWDALNRDPRYQFFALYQAMPNLYIKEEEHDNHFTIGGGAPGGQVSWQITGIRHDPYILAHPIIVEVLKGLGQPVDKGKCIFEPLCR